ncbi:MAG TPA: TonB-dependent receptor, partial [Fibrobacteria bacterium]|nr:TonB-dependent receptor [Fibrobacteria bacterium]
MTSRRLNALTVPLALFALASTAHALRLQGVLSDPDFPAPGPYRLELLETGDTLRVTPGAAFSLNLPRDTVWTLCVRKGEAPAAFEKCVELRHAGKDTVFSARLDGTNAGVIVAEPAAGADSGSAQGGAVEALPVETAAATEADAVRLQKVVLRAQRTPKRAMGRETVSAKLIKRMPGLAEADVIRSIQGLPGVVSSSDFSTKIYVRGGGSDQNLILFDNAPVFSPVHFFGLFSTFLVEGIDDVTFYKGGFPAEYGNRLSSVLDIKSRKGGKDTADAWFAASSVKLSTFAAQTHTEGHQGPARWLLAGRTTYIKPVIDYLRGRGITDLVLDYYFYDMQGNLAWDFGEGREAMLSFYQGRDRLNFDPFQINWGNTVVPVNLKWRLSNVWESRSTLSYSLLSQSFGLDKIFEFYNNIATVQATQSLEYTGLDDHRLAFGGGAERSGVVFRNTQNVAGFTLRDATEFWITHAFAQDKWTPNRKWEVTPGVRLDYINTLGSDGFQAEPRLSVKRNLPADQAVEAHVG